MQKFLIYIFVALFLITCNTENKINVEYAGALKTIMHEGDVSAKINLMSIKDIPHLFAIGAVENLKGEIIILDGKPFILSVKDGNISISESFDVKASLLVYTSVENWEEITIPGKVKSGEELESFLLQSAVKSGIDINSPFPFLIKGKIQSAGWHVIDWEEGDSVHTHEKHKNSGLQGDITDQEITILGFYSDKHTGIFTHKNSNIHMHLVNRSEDIAGHLDQFQPGDNILLLPKKD
jgi:acetolactate decarboxylase